VKQPTWIVVAIVAAIAWIALMVAASYFGYEHRSPVRIPNWQPDANP
jgi:hypothetical protein